MAEKAKAADKGKEKSVPAKGGSAKADKGGKKAEAQAAGAKAEGKAKAKEQLPKDYMPRPMKAYREEILPALVKRFDYKNKLQAPRYAYVAPFYRQAKAVAWDYLKHHGGEFAGTRFHSGRWRWDHCC